MKQPSVKCLKNTYYVTLGESVTLTCFVGGPNNLKRITHGFKWDKVFFFVCVCFLLLGLALRHTVRTCTYFDSQIEIGPVN